MDFFVVRREERRIHRKFILNQSFLSCDKKRMNFAVDATVPTLLDGQLDASVVLLDIAQQCDQSVRVPNVDGGQFYERGEGISSIHHDQGWHVAAVQRIDEDLEGLDQDVLMHFQTDPMLFFGTAAFPKEPRAVDQAMRPVFP